ncbi:site-2 protease family protein [Candidatus Woesearchaeota archaeon]|nr:site-2 protease family protein [Candidatus Woesearchaeota archaeon]
MDGNLISIAIFYSIIILLIIIFRKKLSINYYVSYLYKTKIGLKTRDKIGKRFPKFLGVMGYIGVVIGFIGMISMFGFLLFNFIKMLFWPSPSAPAIALVIPGVRIPGSAFFVPFWYGISALFIIIFVHEMSHGIIARAHKIKVKSSGIGMFLLFPLAFVEPDEKKLSKAPKGKQLSMLAAGSFSNILMAVVAFLLISFLFFPWYSAMGINGVKIEKITEGLPADIAGIEQGEIITAINGDSLLSINDFKESILEVGVNEDIVLSSETKDYHLKTISDPQNEGNALIGINVSAYHDSFFPKILFVLINFLTWVMILGSGIGLANLLPLGPLDGGRILLVSLSKFFKNQTEAMKIWKYISLFCLFLLLANFILPHLI